MKKKERTHSRIDRGSVQTDEDRNAGVRITRRTFLHRSVLAGAAFGAVSQGAFPLINLLEVAHGAETGFSFSWISDTHLYPKTLNTRFVEKAERAVNDVKAMKPAADFLIFGGDLAQLGDPVELQLGEEILKTLAIKKYYIPGEHDWYLDMGEDWVKRFGKPNWTFDHKGVRFIGLDTISRGPDYWTAKKMTPAERMGHMATLDGSVAGAWAGLGKDQLQWLSETLSNWPKDKPVILFSHNPLYEYYPPWNFWVRDWREVQEILRPYVKATNIHGHTHQVLYNEVGTMRCIGMLATSWPWPYAPQGVPALTVPMVRADPGDHFDGVGWAKLTTTPAGKVDNQYMMWRKDIFSQSQVDSGTSDNVNQILSPRFADRP
ncbi:MAG: metallophosphoesterase [Deltaproteobacteria bacterium]|nr:metallophosphoesterase [Deltaproteobacteria bacterium]